MLKCAFVKVFVVVCFHFQKYMSVPFLPIHAVVCTFFTVLFFLYFFLPVPFLPPTANVNELRQAFILKWNNIPQAEIKTTC